MTMFGSKIDWLKIAALGGVALALAACQSTEPDPDDFYQPVAHYERHPIIVTKSGAHAQACGSWPEDLSRNPQNGSYENFGCSQQANIAAMVANPQDLRRPRKETASDAMRRSKVFDQYRQGDATAAKPEEGQKVVISDAAKGGQ